MTLVGGQGPGWTMTGDVEGLVDLLDARLNGIDPPDENDDIMFAETERFRAYDPHGGRGKDGPFEVATNYAAIAVDGRAMLVKAGLPDDSFEPDDAEAFGRHLIRCAARARLPSEPVAGLKSTCERRPECGCSIECSDHLARLRADAKTGKGSHG